MLIRVYRKTLVKAVKPLHASGISDNEINCYERRTLSIEEIKSQPDEVIGFNAIDCCAVQVGENATI